MRRSVVRKGATRVVILMGGYAFKFPRPYSFRTFVNGLLANMTETEFGRLKHPLLAPVVFSVPLGLLVVMPRAVVFKPGTVSAEAALKAWRLAAEPYQDIDLLSLVESKEDSVGVYRSRVVAVDYG